jgi:ubiquinone/menaquinone biosynthesis C-methylase UbiE
MPESALGSTCPSTRPAVEVVYGVDPSPLLLAMARRQAAAVRFPVILERASAERLPVADRSVDTVVVTWSLCSIPEPVAALREMWRVLKVGGELLFVEHGRAPDPGVRACEDRLTPAWKRVAGGCQLNRQMDELIEAEGFRITRLEREYGQGCRLFSYRYRGTS